MPALLSPHQRIGKPEGRERRQIERGKPERQGQQNGVDLAEQPVEPLFQVLRGVASRWQRVHDGISCNYCAMRSAYWAAVERAPAASSASCTTAIVRNTLAGLTLIESMPRSARKRAISG